MSYCPPARHLGRLLAGPVCLAALLALPAPAQEARPETAAPAAAAPAPAPPPPPPPAPPAACTRPGVGVWPIGG